LKGPDLGATTDCLVSPCDIERAGSIIAALFTERAVRPGDGARARIDPPRASLFGPEEPRSAQTKQKPKENP